MLYMEMELDVRDLSSEELMVGSDEKYVDVFMLVDVLYIPRDRAVVDDGSVSIL